jgi:hypothetical protein
MKRQLKTYGFSKRAMLIVSPVIEAIEQNHIMEAEQMLSKLSLDVCEKIEKGILSPKEADDYFSLIDLYVTDNFPTLELSKSSKEILLEGMLLHDYGEDYGADLVKLRTLARKLQ